MTRSPGTEEPLPAFRYHLDPIATGSVEPSGAGCVVCGRFRGFIYVGPVHAIGDHDEEICPWCIADGSAAEVLDAEFTDVGWGVPPGVPETVSSAVAKRTPGFVGWQQHRWLFHCGDAAAFLGAAGYADLRAAPDALEMLLHENDELGWTADRSRAYVQSLRVDGEATDYLFRCLHCDRRLAYSDMS